jgi:protein-L-isoaspartate(D-aspartate) O-methyltransferase
MTDPIPKDSELIDKAALQADFINKVIAPTGVPAEVLEAFTLVHRSEFAPDEYVRDAYADRIIPLKDDSTISQPSLVALMTGLLDLQPTHTVLEVGTATGYQASVISRIVDKVHTIEVDGQLAEVARSNVDRLGYDNIVVHHGDGMKGVSHCQFDSIIITAALKAIPDELVAQLKVGGRIVAPVGPELHVSMLTIYTKKQDGTLEITEAGECFFVPIETDGELAWSLEEREQAKIGKFMYWFQEMVIHFGKDPNEEVERHKKTIEEVLRLDRELTDEEWIALARLFYETMSS